MSQTQSAADLATVRVTNIGGIDETEVSFSPGMISLTGRNATNRTSLLHAIMAALGSTNVSLKGDADEGLVELQLDGGVYTRTLTRDNGTVVMDGEPYLDDSEGADLFAFLLENNEARQAVARGDDLREVIMQPVDTDAIQAEITRLETEQRGLDDQLDRLGSIADRLPALETRRTQLEEEIKNKRAALEETETDIETADNSVADTREQNEFEDVLDDIQRTRSELDDVRYRLDTERESIHALEAEHDDCEEELEELSETPADDLSEIETEIDRLREHKQSLESTISQLQRVLQFNEEMLDGENPELQRTLQSGNCDDDEGALTDQLLASATTVCWTCGSAVEHETIDETLGNLRSLRQEKSQERTELDTELDELIDRRDDRQNERDRRERLERTLEEIDREIADRESTIAALMDEREELACEIEALETEIDAIEEQEYSDLLDLHKEANQLEFELGRLESDREDVIEEIDSIETDLEERADLEERRSEIQAELADLRTRIEQLEAQAIEEFNEHMQTILGVLEYENIERIWIERVEREVRDGRRTIQKRVFDLHVVRSTAAGATYEDTVEHLSESEREVTGLVFALAGYLVHNLSETLPFMVVDSLEALDSDRIATLVEYFEAYVDYLLVALLPEDAAALENDHQQITDI